MYTKHYLQVQQRSICFLDVGSKFKKTIVLIPGFPLTKESWNEQVKVLSINFRVLSFDFAGLGESPNKTTFVTIDSHVSDLIALLDHCNVQKAIVLGLSMGGYVALRTMNLYPERVEALILSNTRADSDSNEAKTKRFKQIDSIQNNGLETFATALAEGLLSENYKKNFPEKINLLSTSINKQSVSGLCGNLIAMAARHNANDFLSDIKCPVLIITGDNDKVIPHEEGQKMHDKIKGSTLVKIENCGHLSNQEQPELFIKAVCDFVKQAL